MKGIIIVCLDFVQKQYATFSKGVDCKNNEQYDVKIHHK